MPKVAVTQSLFLSNWNVPGFSVVLTDVCAQPKLTPAAPKADTVLAFVYPAGDEVYELPAEAALEPPTAITTASLLKVKDGGSG